MRGRKEWRGEGKERGREEVRKERSRNPTHGGGENGEREGGGEREGEWVGGKEGMNRKEGGKEGTDTPHEPAQKRGSDRTCLGRAGDEHKWGKHKRGMRSLSTDDQHLYLMAAIVAHVCQAHHPVFVTGPFILWRAGPQQN